MTVVAELSYAFGTGTVTAMIWFPITYYAMRKQFKLKPLVKLWRSFWYCVGFFAISYFFLGRSEMNTTAGVTMFFMFPLVASASILYWTSREKLPKPLVHNNEKTLIVKEPSLTPFPVRDAIKVTIVGTKELIVFRFLLIAWGIGLLILIFFGSSYLMIKWSQNAVFDEAIACLKRVEKETTDCKAPQVEKNGTCTYLSNLCSNEIDRMTEKETRAESWLYEDLWLFIVPSFLFYGIRWAITGRLKPLWLIR